MFLGHIGSLTARDAFALGMTLKGYDPGLSVQSALRLPRSLNLADSIIAAVSGADYISLNIPYIKGDDGTHGIIGPDVISHFKPNAVLLNFARGELVNSEAMKQFLDAGDGRYVTDFPDDLLWDHKNAIVLPHLGASTVEAEDAAVSANQFVANFCFALIPLCSDTYRLRWRISFAFERLPWQPIPFASSSTTVPFAIV